MIFNSIVFLLFFVAVYLLYWNLKPSGRLLFLLLASIVFYGTWGLEQEGWKGIRWTLHFLGAIFLNFLFVRAMFRFPNRKALMLRLSIVANLVNLAFFKYYDFFRNLLLDVGVPLSTDAEPRIFLPLAISFYTFQMVAYTVDVYRGRIQKDESFLRYALFILFFPQLIAGPIMRAEDFMEQMDRPLITKERVYGGCWLIIGGLFKKVLLADPMGEIVAPVFREPQTYSGTAILLAGMGFSLQVYSDFSGYTDIARGTAKLLGFDIPENFRSPFFSKSVRELWQRWHITLASWLRDYIYFPLGGNRLGEWRTYVNLIVTFTLGGLWHGADYTYVCWGAFWGVLLAGERFVENKLKIRTVPEYNRFLIVLKIAFVFFLFAIGALMFRSNRVVYADREYSAGHMMVEIFKGIYANHSSAAARNFSDAGGDATIVSMTFGKDVFSLNEISPVEGFVVMFIALFFLHLAQYRENFFSRWRKYDFWLLILTSAILGGVLMPSLATGAHQFIYFVF